MGLSKKLNDLEPVALYTFDQRESFINEYEGSGYFTNKIETDLPPLELKTSGLFFLEYDLPIITPALSLLENTGLYKSYSSGYSSFYRVNTINRLNEISRYTMTNASSICENDLTEFDSLIKLNGKYSFFFQIKVERLNITTGVIPIVIESEYIKGQCNYGVFSYTIFADEMNILSGATFNFGYNNYLEPLVGEVDITFDNSLTSFGFMSECDIKYNIFETENTYNPKDPIQFYLPDMLDSRTIRSNDRSFFRFGKIILSLDLMDPNTVGIYYGKYGASSTGLLETPLATMPIGANANPYNVYIEVDMTENRIYCYLNKGSMTGNRPIDQHNPLTVFSIGIPSYLYESDIVTENHPILSEFKDTHKFYNMTFPTFNVKFDNVTIFNKALTQQDRIDLYDLNTTFIQQYIDYGYAQLYDFSDLYDKKTKRYIENNVTIKNLISGTSYLKLYTNKRNASELSYVERYIEDIYEYSLNNKVGSHIGSPRTSNFSEQYSIIRAVGTLSFSFKTSDTSGLLFANSRYEYHSQNLSLILNGGTLEIWIGNERRTGVGGFSNGQWHNICIVMDTANTLFYIDDILFYTHNGSVVLTTASTIFGNGMPGLQQLECEYALIGYSTKKLTKNEISSLNKNMIIYTVRGQVTLNNIAVGTYVYICNHVTGELIERIITSDTTGNFTYTNRFPYSISVIATDKTLLQGKSYIIDPIEVI